MNVQLKRVYETPEAHDGFRVLVDRIWPRGLSKQKAALDLWLKDIAPSTQLRKWFAHDPAKWDGFKERYFKELDAMPGTVDEMRTLLRKPGVTLLYAAHDEERNQAVALLEYLDGKR